MTDADKNSKSNSVYYLFGSFAAIASIVFLASVGSLFFQSIVNLSGDGGSFLLGLQALVKEVSQWFDNIFFEYNLLLLTITVSVPPLITFFYVVGMKDEKLRRLKQELPEDAFLADDENYSTEERVNSIFRFRHYMGSMSMLTIIVLLGCMIILLLKPLPLSQIGHGVDYQKGANFLMLGPYMDLFINGDQAYMTKLIATLTAFQFGFLGAYVYFITHLVRSYFTLDLTPNTFVASSVRMMMGAVLALVFAFLLDEHPSYIPLLSFAIGFFPQRGLMLLEKVSSALFAKMGHQFVGKDYYATSLSELPGMSFAHELRLEREGYDNAENLSLANPKELAIRTGFGYCQLRKWISQAKLLQHLRRDYKPFLRATGLSSVDEVNSFLEQWRKQDPAQDPVELLVSSVNTEVANKIRIVCALCFAPAATQCERRV